MKIAVASSGLGHVSRGMEAWAEALAAALHEQAIDVTLFRGAGPKRKAYEVVLPCIKRTSPPAHIGKLLNRLGGWRVGLGSAAAVESFSFGVQLLQHLRNGYDIVHVQQGSLALFLERAKRLGLIKCALVFGNGQKGQPEVFERFPYLHFLSPYGMKEVVDHVGKQPFWRVIPNFIDTDIFSPADGTAIRRRFGLPADSLVILSVGMVEKAVKRMDYLIRETAMLLERTQKELHLVIAGSPHEDAQEIEDIGRSLLGTRCHIFYDIPRESMPDLYQAADIFVLCSLREALGMAIIEAMSCGLPVVCHDFPVMRWVAGNGGVCVDMTESGALLKVLSELCRHRELRDILGWHARSRAIGVFSKQSVIASILELYQDVLLTEKSRSVSFSSKRA